jgi:DNA-binding Xre family transcriptional regulator
MRIQYNKTVQIINRQEYEKTNLKETAQISANFLAKLSKNKPCQIRHPYENCRGT